MHEDINCPYCDAPININHDDGYGYEEDEVYEQECDECGKNFAYTTSISFFYEPTKADCLNGAEHKYKPIRTTGFPDAVICEDCGAEIRGNYVDPFAPTQKE
jgi:hypothetical protein